MRFVSRLFLLLAFLVLSFSAPVRAGESEAEELKARALAKEFSEAFPEILIDARGSRGGNGDIAAAYLTVSDWLQNSHVTSHITISVDENGKRRLLNLAQGNERFASQVTIHEPQSPPPEQVFSMYAVFANPSGTYRYSKDIGTTYKLAPDSTLIVQTVLGNTENQNSLHPDATVENGGRIYDWAPAGLANTESGIYTDIVAQRLRPMNLEQVRADILGNLHLVTDDFSKQSLSTVLDGSKLRGAKAGVVYGISSEQTQKQFMTYLQGLAGQTNESFVLFTPSAFREKALFDASLKDKVVFLTSQDQIPETAEPNRIYIIETKTLPHKVFVGLMAYSMKVGVVPVGAGDGFLSAAIDLGGPFVLTQVPWNRANVAQLKKMLIDLAFEFKVPSADITFFKELLKRNYESVDFRTASALHRFTPLFRVLKSRVPRLSKRVMEIAVGAGKFHDPSTVPRLQDLTLQKSVLKGGRTSTLALSLSRSEGLICRDAFMVPAGGTAR
jgi:hypothetical protein